MNLTTLLKQVDKGLYKREDTVISTELVDFCLWYSETQPNLYPPDWHRWLGSIVIGCCRTVFWQQLDVLNVTHNYYCNRNKITNFRCFDRDHLESLHPVVNWSHVKHEDIRTYFEERYCCVADTHTNLKQVEEKYPDISGDFQQQAAFYLSVDVSVINQAWGDFQTFRRVLGRDLGEPEIINEGDLACTIYQPGYGEGFMWLDQYKKKIGTYALPNFLFVSIVGQEYQLLNLDEFFPNCELIIGALMA